MKKILLLVLIFVMCGNADANNPKITYLGGTVADEDIGIMIMTDQKKQIMAITSPDYHYAFIMPYLENWVFEKGEQYYLFGNNKNKNVSISIYISDGKQDKEYLDLIKQNLIENNGKNGTETADFLVVNGTTVLKTLVDVEKATKKQEFKGWKQQNLYITKTNANSRFVLHFSIINDNNGQPEIEQYLDSLTRSFKVDFMLK